MQLQHGLFLAGRWNEHSHYLAVLGDFQALDLTGTNLVEEIEALRLELRRANRLSIYDLCSLI